jgi:hypothetical protein
MSVQANIRPLHNAEFLEEARREARHIFSSRGEVSADEVRDVLGTRGLAPLNQSAWGGIFRTAEWVPVDWKQSVHPSNNGRAIRVWARA